MLTTLFLLLGTFLPGLPHAWCHVSGAAGHDSPRRSLVYQDRYAELVVVSATWGREPKTEEETENLIKSILIHAQCPIHLTLLTDHTSHEGVARILGRARGSRRLEAMAEFAIPQHLFREVVKGWGIKIEHHSGPAALAKFLLPLLLPRTYKRVLVVDVDMLSGSDICELWHLFADAKPTTLFSFPEDTSGFCSCVGLLHLDRMRAAGWVLPGQERYRKRNLPASAYNMDLARFFQQANSSAWKLGDQTMFIELWKAYRDNFPDMLQFLPASWDISHCLRYQRVYPVPVEVQEPWEQPYKIMAPPRSGLAFKLVHFNCFKWYNETTLGDWGVVYKWVRDYNWDWLKREQQRRIE